MTLFDDGQARISADVRDKDFRAAPDARVTGHVIGPAGLSASIELTPVPNAPGRFQADWAAPAPGLYVAELTARRGADEIGSDSVTFQRLDGVAEDFHPEQNRALLQSLSSSTGGRYVRPADLQDLVREIPYSHAGITTQQIKELWNMPFAFLLILSLRGSEWLLRRKWGIV
jgi:hypothetical protein